MRPRALVTAALLARALAAHADPAVFTAEGHAIVPATAVAGVSPGCAVTLDNGHTGRLIVREVMDDWAVVRVSGASAGRSPPSFSAVVPAPGDTLTVLGGARVVVAAASPGGYALRRVGPGALSPGAIVVDQDGRWVAMLRGHVAGDTVEALALASIRGDLRAASRMEVPACAAVSARPTQGRCAPEGPRPSEAALALARRAMARRGGAMVTDIAGDRFALARAGELPDARPGCATGALRAWRVDAGSGLALVRREDPDAHAGVPIMDTEVHECATLYTLDASGALTPAVVTSSTETALRLRTARLLSTDDAVVLDPRGLLVGIVTARADDELSVARAAPAARFLAGLADSRNPPACVVATAPTTAEPLATEGPVVPAGAVIPLGASDGAVAVHVGADGVYATLANHLSDVSSGCVVRRPGRRYEEVLTVDAGANVALFHALAATQRPDGSARDAPLPHAEDAPIPLVERRPPLHARVWVSTPAGTRPATIASQSTDDLVVAFADDVSPPPGSPVLDDGLHLVGLLERPLRAGQWRVRAAASLRRLLPGLRRDIATQTCFPTYGTPIGAVLAFGAQFGMTVGSDEVNGVQYPLSATLLWYNTWYFHGALGARLSSTVLPRFSLAGGPVFFRSPGDGEVGFGIHVEVEVPVTDAQREAGTIEAARALYGFEIQGMPYLSNSAALHFALAAGLAQHGDLTRASLGFGISFNIGVSFGHLRWDRP